MRAKALGPWCVPVGVLKERKAGQCSWWEPVEKRMAMGQARSQGPFVQGLPWGSLGEKQVLLNGGRKKSRIGCGMVTVGGAAEQASCGGKARVIVAWTAVAPEVCTTSFSLGSLTVFSLSSALVLSF